MKFLRFLNLPNLIIYSFLFLFVISIVSSCGGGGGGSPAGAAPPNTPQQTPPELSSEPFDPAMITTDPETGLTMVSDQAVVRFAAGTTESRIAEILSARGARIVGSNTSHDTYQIELPSGFGNAAGNR